MRQVSSTRKNSSTRTDGAGMPTKFDSYNNTVFLDKSITIYKKKQKIFIKRNNFIINIK